jgi:AcrR family transcriptional regulator
MIAGCGVDLLQEADPGVFGMQDVADRAGVSLRTVYRTFPTKDDLLVGVLGAIKERFDKIAGAPPTTRDEFDASMSGAVRAVYELEPLYRALFATIAGREVHQSGAGTRRHTFETAFADELAGLPEGRVRLIVSLLHLITSAPTVLWLKDYAGLDADDASEAIAWAIAAIADAARGEVDRRKRPGVRGIMPHGSECAGWPVPRRVEVWGGPPQAQRLPTGARWDRRTMIRAQTLPGWDIVAILPGRATLNIRTPGRPSCGVSCGAEVRHERR